MLPQCSHITAKRGRFYYRRRLPRPDTGEIALALTTANYREAEHAAGASEAIVDELTVHEGQGTSRVVYKKDMPLRVLAKAISKVTWPEVGHNKVQKKTSRRFSSPLFDSERTESPPWGAAHWSRMMDRHELFCIKLNVEVGVGSGEPDEFLSHYDGEVEIYDDDRDASVLVARVSLFLVHGEAAERAGVSLYDVLDADAKTEPFMSLLHKSEAENFDPAVLRILDEDCVTTLDMIILDRIEILPEFRGNRLTRRVTQALLDRVAGGSRIAAMKVFPLQFEPGAKKQSDEWSERMALPH